MTPRQHEIVVVGAGVIGLTTAVRLLERGLKVRVVADRLDTGTTSHVAAGLWYPYKAGGSSTKRWALETLTEYLALATDPSTGVRRYPCTSHVRRDDPAPFWSEAEVEYEKVRQGMIRCRLPVAEPSRFLAWLTGRIDALGGSVRALPERLSRLEEAGGDLVVNCSGIASRDLVGDDSVYPIRGVVVRMAGTGIQESITDEVDHDIPTYMIPNTDYCVLGGTAEVGNWDLGVSDAEVKAIVERCAGLDPRVRKGTIIGTQAGLRPGRPEVRVEPDTLESGRPVIHNYGHGGSGYTLAWGCAEEVAAIAARLIG